MRQPKKFKTTATTFSYQHGIDLANWRLQEMEFVKHCIDKKNDSKLDKYIENRNPDRSKKAKISHRAALKRRVKNFGAIPSKPYKIEDGYLWIISTYGGFEPWKGVTKHLSKPDLK